MDDKTRPDETGYRFIGKPMPRKEDARLITGKGRFTDDFNLDGQAYAAMVRSPYPHARIVAIDAARAKAMPGVLGVFTGADCAADKLGPIPHDPVPKTKFDMKLTGPGGGAVFIGPHALLPADKARHVGEAVAMVVAETKAQAMDAAEAVEVRYEELPFVLHSEDAMRPGAPAVWDEVPNNVTVETVFGDVEATDAGVRARRARGGEEFPYRPRHRRAARAARGARPLRRRDRPLHALCRLRRRGAAEERTRRRCSASRRKTCACSRTTSAAISAPATASSSNSAWCCGRAKKLGRPVKFTATRSEAFLSDYQGRDLVTKVELALDDKHRFIAMRATNISNVGARCVSLSPLSKGSGLIPGSYAIPATTLRAMAVFTNTMPTKAYRSSGRPEVTFAIERLVDAAADAAWRRSHRIAPQEPRSAQSHAVPQLRRHALRQRPLRGEHGLGDGHRRLERFCGAPPRSRNAAASCLGRGLANYVEVLDRRAARAGAHQGAARKAASMWSSARSRAGRATRRASPRWSRICCTCRPRACASSSATPTWCRVGGGSHSGRSMRHAATVFSKAAVDLIAKGKAIAAVVMGAAPESVSFSDGRFVSRDTNRTFDFLELAARGGAAQACPTRSRTASRWSPTTRCTSRCFPTAPRSARSRSIPIPARSTITRYASVDDVGRCINPLIVHGQTHGAIAQGVGQAMWEQIYLDPDSGQPLTGSLMDYGMPRADTLPPFKTEIAEVLSPTNPLGIKAGGEGGTTAAPAVIVSAILDALGELGVRDITMPATPYAVWTAIQKAKAQ